MTKEARNFNALLAVLVTIALISFTVQAMLDSETEEKSIELTAPVTGNIAADGDNGGEGLNRVLTDISEWLFEG